MTTPLPPTCPAATRRIAFDLKRGHTTSQAVIDFLRRTCLCNVCQAARAPRHAAMSMRPPSSGGDLQ